MILKLRINKSSYILLLYYYIYASNRITNKNRFKGVLEEKGIKRIWLAEQLGKSYNMVNGYVQNRQQPRLEVLYEIASILNIEVTELFVKPKDNANG